MPAWWGGKKSKSGRKKEEHQISSDAWKRNEKPKSPNEVSTWKLAKNRGAETGCGSVSVLVSDGEKRGHPLPLPTVLACDHEANSGSASSISSSGSLDDPPDYGFDGLYRYLNGYHAVNCGFFLFFFMFWEVEGGGVVGFC